MIFPLTMAPRPDAKCWTAELALMKPPRRLGSTLLVTIDSPATIRPALQSMRAPTDSHGNRQGHHRQVRHDKHQDGGDRRDHAIDRQLAVTVGQAADQAERPQA